MKIAIYTAIYGDKDHLKPPIIKKTKLNVDYFLFSDNEKYDVYPYKKILRHSKYKDIAKDSKEIKINIINEGFFEKYDILVWHDANIQLNQNKLLNFIEDLNEFNIVAYDHHRNCVYGEAIACIKSNKDSSFKIFKQILWYFRKGMPVNFGLTSNGFLIINNNSFENRKMLKEWWSQTYRFTRRDQLSLPFTLYKLNKSIKILKGSIYESEYLNFHNHLYEDYKINDLVINDRKLFDGQIIFLIRVIRKLIILKDRFKKKSIFV